MINSQLRTLGRTLIWSQLFLALSWVAYLFYLPRLVRDAGLALQVVPWLLAMDQAIFVLTDCATGASVGKMAKVIRRIGPYIVALAAVSCLAFLAIPWVTPLLGPNPTLTIILIAVWAATSSALRAPPLLLLSRYASNTWRPAGTAMYFGGIALAGVMAPYLTGKLAGVDPRLAFAIASGGLIMATAALLIAEQLLPLMRSPVRVEDIQVPPGIHVEHWGFVVGIVLLAFGFQIHVFLDPSTIASLFWIGFSIGIVPAPWLIRRYGPFAVMAAAVAFGALAMLGTHSAAGSDLATLLQGAVGLGWGLGAVGGLAAALAFRTESSKGWLAGAWFSVLALAALVRILTTMTGFKQSPAFATIQEVGAAAWFIAATVFVVLAVNARRRGRFSVMELDVPQQHESEGEPPFIIYHPFPDAIDFYRERSSKTVMSDPGTLEELLADASYPFSKRYLRKVLAESTIGPPEPALVTGRDETAAAAGAEKGAVRKVAKRTRAHALSADNGRRALERESGADAGSESARVWRLPAVRPYKRPTLSLTYCRGRNRS